MIYLNNISSSNAFEMLKNLGNSCVIEADDLNYLIEDDATVQCMINDKVLIIIDTEEKAEYVSIIPRCHEFDADEIIKVINENCNNPNILVNIQQLSAQFTSLLCDMLNEHYKYEREIIDYICESKDILSIDDSIRLLNPMDKETFAACFDETITNRPPAATLFDVFINKHRGEIFAAFEDEKMIGYLSFTPILDSVYDVDYIYVLPEKRNTGIGKRLAKAYASYAAKQERYAYWSNAKNEASEKTAASCGFVKIRTIKKYVCN